MLKTALGFQRCKGLSHGAEGTALLVAEEGPEGREKQRQRHGREKRRVGAPDDCCRPSPLAAQATALCQCAVRVLRPLRPADPELWLVPHALRQHRCTREHLGGRRGSGKAGIHFCACWGGVAIARAPAACCEPRMPRMRAAPLPCHSSGMHLTAGQTERERESSGHSRPAPTPPPRTMCRLRGGSSTFSLRRRSPSRSPLSTLQRAGAAAPPGGHAALMQAVKERRAQVRACTAAQMQVRARCLPAARLSRYSARSSFSNREAMPGNMVVPPLQGGSSGGGVAVTCQSGRKRCPGWVAQLGGSGSCWLHFPQLLRYHPHLSTMLPYSSKRLWMSLLCSGSGRFHTTRSGPASLGGETKGKGGLDPMHRPGATRIQGVRKAFRRLPVCSCAPSQPCLAPPRPEGCTAQQGAGVGTGLCAKAAALAGRRHSGGPGKCCAQGRHPPLRPTWG